MSRSRPTCRRPVLPRDPSRRRPRSGDEACSDRYRAAGQGGDDDQSERGGQRGQVEPHEPESGNALGSSAQKKRERHDAEDHGQPAGQQRDQKGFAQLQPDELRARCAECTTHGQAAAASLGANQKQIRNVGARNEQHDGHRAQQHPQRCPRRRTDEAVEHRLHDRAVLLDDPRVAGRPAEAGRKFLRESRELDASCSRVTPGFMRAISGSPKLPGTNRGRPDLRGHPEQRLLGWEAELRRHDADHLTHFSGDVVRLSDDRRIAAEPGAPEPVADDCDPIPVVWNRQPPELRPRAERGKDIVRRKYHRNSFDAIVRTQRRCSPAEQKDAVEELRALLVMHVELLAEAETLGEVRSGRRAGQHDEAVRIRKRQRLQQDRIDDAEHPHHRPDGQGKGADRGEEKARRADERSPPVTEVRKPLHVHRPQRKLGHWTESGPQMFAIRSRKDTRR